ncbi:hypothetical protein ACFX2G_035207 [Malus domestica]
MLCRRPCYERPPVSLSFCPSASPATAGSWCRWWCYNASSGTFFPTKPWNSKQSKRNGFRSINDEEDGQACRKKILQNDIRITLMVVVRCCMKRDYLAAMDQYIKLAIGNACKLCS